MKNKILISVFIVIILLIALSLKIYASEAPNLDFGNSAAEETADTTSEKEISEEEEADEPTTAYTPSSSNSGSSYVTSVSTISSNYDSNLWLSNIVSIILICVGILLILFSIAILIRMKR